MRIYAAAGALLGWFALLLQLYLILAQSPAGALAMLGTVITYFSFFTILTNILVALVFTAIVVAPGNRTGAVFLPSFGAGRHGGLHRYRRASSTGYCCGNYGIPRARSGLPTYFCMPSFRLGYVVYWLLFAPRTGLRWKDAVGWLAYPGVYLVYILARGAVSGLYPYPFVDVKVLGYGGVAGPRGGILAGFSGYGLAGSGGGPLDAKALCRLSPGI